MGVVVYCLLCKRELLITRSFAEAFKEIDWHLQRRHKFYWHSPSGIPLKDFAEAWLAWLKKGEGMDAYEKEVLSEILNDFKRYKKFLYAKKPEQGFIVDVFALFKNSSGIRRAFIEKIKERKKARWIYPQKFRYMQRHSKLVRDYYQAQRLLSRLLQKSEEVREEVKEEEEELSPQERLGLYPEVKFGQRPAPVRRKLFGV